MTIAAILEQAGFVPTVPVLSQKMGTLQRKAQSHVPIVPTVPAQNGEGVNAVDPLRTRLLSLAAVDGIDPDHVNRLRNLDVAACAGLDDDQLAAYLDMVRDAADRHAGRVPAGDTARMLCKGCGPVWIHPTIADVLPMVDGWPRALGCPWCHVRKVGGTIPRPQTGATP